MSEQVNAAVDQAVIADIAFRESRRSYIGGSDIAALLGVAPPTWERTTPLSLYFSKTEPPKADTQGKGVKRRGKRWEAVVAEMLIEKLEELGHTVEIVSYNKRYVDPDFSFLACEIDFEIRLDGNPEIINVELKTVHPYKVAEWGEEGTDASPVWYTAQCQMGLGITRRRRCIIAPLFGADEIRVYWIEAADDVISNIRSIAVKFWNENIIPRVPPAPGGLADLDLLFPKDCGQEIELADNQAFVDAIAELKASNDEFDKVTARWNAAEEIAKLAMGDAAVATIDGKKACTWKHQSQEKLDVKRLRIEQPATAAEYVREITFRKFLLSVPRKKK